MKILWAIDSQCLDDGVQRCAISTLKNFLSYTRAEIFPVYLYVPSSLELSSAFDAERLRSVREQAQGVINRLLNGSERTGIHPVKALLQLPADKNPIGAIVGYGESVGADVILAATHARTGYPKLVHGSFVETLLLHSTIPLLSVSPRTRADGKFDDLLFATDYSDEARRAFPRALEFAKRLRLRVTLFHLGTGNAVPREWLNIARKAGVECSSIEEDGKGSSVLSRLTDLASVSGRILAMVTHADPASPGIGTSITREMIAQSPAPLWAFHPPGTAAAI